MQKVERILAFLAGRPGLILAAGALLLHLWANSGYDYFIDELNFIVCGQHLAWGYIDHPPLVPLIARIALQEYTQGEAAGMIGLGLRTVSRRYAEALDRLTEIFLKVKLLEPMLECQEGGGRR